MSTLWRNQQQRRRRRQAFEKARMSGSAPGRGGGEGGARRGGRTEARPRRHGRDRISGGRCRYGTRRATTYQQALVHNWPRGTPRGADRRTLAFPGGTSCKTASFSSEFLDGQATGMSRLNDVQRVLDSGSWQSSAPPAATSSCRSPRPWPREGVDVLEVTLTVPGRARRHFRRAGPAREQDPAGGGDDPGRGDRPGGDLGGGPNSS